MSRKSNLTPRHSKGFLAPYDRRAADTAWDRLTETLTQDRDLENQLISFYTSLMRGKQAPEYKLLDSIFGASPFLSELVLQDLRYTHRLLQQDSASLLDQELLNLQSNCPPSTAQADVMRHLRHAKRRIALGLAIADLAGTMPVMTVTHYLSTFADTALQLCLSHLLHKALQDGQITGPALVTPTHNSGVFILAMGKMGAFELNYSSDIDVIVFFDPDKVAYTGRKSLQELYVRMTRDLSRMMQDHTADGYVFRVDLRLRPDAGATQAAVNIHAAEHYYESHGQNWERAAMIKARVAAGDYETGAQFLKALSPFIWRKYLDFASIEDIQSLKRQFHAHRGHKEFAVAGHNIKLGRGGIREIELFVQTQQLILGGKDPALRISGTVSALDTFVSRRLLAPDVRDALVRSYSFLRTIEHRLQMINDTQTQTLPTDPDDLMRLSRFCGFETAEAFSEAIMSTLKTVNKHYAALFAEASSLSAQHGNLVFTGIEDDPDTLITLTDMGFTDAAAVARCIRTWHHGRFRATQSARAREALTSITPYILEQISTLENPDEVFRRFDAFVRALPTGIQLFSLIANTPALFLQIRRILSAAPKLSDYLARRSQVIDSLLSPGLTPSTGSHLPDQSTLRQDLQRHLNLDDAFEDVLLDVRRFTNDKRFLTGLRWLRNPTQGEECTADLTTLAECVLQTLLPYVQADFAKTHGVISDSAFVIVGLGKLGGREMAPSSDLDLIFVYEAPEGAVSDGQRGLEAPRYFARLSQRFITALTAMTQEGTAYEVDMRLRPSGSSGPLATSFERFRDYQNTEAWTWEHLAMTRARVVAGTSPLAQKVRTTIRSALCQDREKHKIATDVLEMRTRTRAAHATKNIWDLKHIPGGVLELETMTQTLMLMHAAKSPTILRPHTTQALLTLGQKGILPQPAAQRLTDISLLYRNVAGIKRLCLEADQNDPSSWPKSFQSLIIEAGYATSLPDLENKLRNAQSDLQNFFDDFITPDS